MPTASDLAQRQLDAYNARDLEAFVACYHPQVEVRDFPADTLRFQGHAELRARYGPLFERPALHAHLVSRTSQGSVVIDEERVEGLRDGEDVSAVAIYEVEGELIRRVWFVREREA
ncbi:MAG: nuclear transport factor 2 family protein [Planctomycetes bacterium]|nr:nuclear transport factor 2 family protein [Planctomycetota bacterium]